MSADEYAQEVAHTTEDLRFTTECYSDAKASVVLLSISAVQGTRRIGEDIAFAPDEAIQLTELLKKAARKVER